MFWGVCVARIQGGGFAARGGDQVWGAAEIADYKEDAGIRPGGVDGVHWFPGLKTRPGNPAGGRDDAGALLRFDLSDLLRQVPSTAAQKPGGDVLL